MAATDEKQVIWEGTWIGDKYRVILSRSIFAVDKWDTIVDLMTQERTSLWRSITFERDALHVIQQALLWILPAKPNPQET